jgi:hypothetical protein
MVRSHARRLSPGEKARTALKKHKILECGLWFPPDRIAGIGQGGSCHARLVGLLSSTFCELLAIKRIDTSEVPMCFQILVKGSKSIDLRKRLSYASLAEYFLLAASRQK